MYYKIDKNLNIRKIRYVKSFIITSLTLNVIFALLTLYSFSNPQTIVKVKNHRDTIVVPEDIILNDSSITKELFKNDVMQINVALAQAKLETGYYKSKVCKENKNLFGIKYHKCKYVKGQLNNHASYHTYKDNIKCYAHVQKKYLKNIDGKYAEAKDYLPTLKKIK